MTRATRFYLCAGFGLAPHGLPASHGAGGAVPLGMHMADATTAEKLDRLIEKTLDEVRRNLDNRSYSPGAPEEATHAARTLEALVRARTVLGPAPAREPPSTNTRPGLKHETLSGDVAAEPIRRGTFVARGDDGTLREAASGPRLGVLVPLDVIRPVLEMLQLHAGMCDWPDFIRTPCTEEMRAFVAAVSPKPSQPLYVVKDKPEPGSNEMVANATRERLHHEVHRLGTGGTDLERSKADILRLVDGLHTLAVSGEPETSGASETVYWAHTGMPASTSKLSDLDATARAKVRRCADGKLWLPHTRVAPGKPDELCWESKPLGQVEPAPSGSAETMRAASTAVEVSVGLKNVTHMERGQCMGEACTKGSPTVGMHLMECPANHLFLVAAPSASAARLDKLEAVANAARDMHVGVHGAQQRLEDALRELDGGGTGAVPPHATVAAFSAEAMRGIVLALIDGKVRNLRAHGRAGQEVDAAADARRWTAQADILTETAQDIRLLPLREVR